MLIFLKERSVQNIIPKNDLTFKILTITRGNFSYLPWLLHKNLFLELLKLFHKLKEKYPISFQIEKRK